jgi:adenosylcobinamide amidohydrolase
VLVWRFEPAVRAISSATLGGGFGRCCWAINAEVGHAYQREDPAAHLTEIASGLALPGRGVGMLTAAPVLDVACGQDGGVRVDATVGLSTPTWAAAADGAGRAWRPGTINLVCFVPVRLSDAALVNTVVTVTEAKSQALFEVGVPGTGTASDAVLVCCPTGRRKAAEPYGGPRSVWGARLAGATQAAVTKGSRQYLASFR